MGTVERKGSSRRQQQKNHGLKEKRGSHFRTVCFGGFEEGQVLCYLWDIVKALEPKGGTRTDQSGNLQAEPEDITRTVQRGKLEKQLRRRIRVEMRRYFARCKRRNMRAIAMMLCTVLSLCWLFGVQIGIDRVSGNSMYPYLNNGDWIVYSRAGKGIRRDDVVVFEKNGEIMVKRVAGLPGDRVEMNHTGSRVLVNGEETGEEYMAITRPEEETGREPLGAPQTVMQGQYLVLGDNRAESVDSRDSSVGTVPSEHVLGKVIWIVRKGR